MKKILFDPITIISFLIVLVLGVVIYFHFNTRYEQVVVGGCTYVKNAYDPGVPLIHAGDCPNHKKP